MFQEEILPVQQLIPTVMNLSFSRFNLWSHSAITSHGKRDNTTRGNLKKELGYSKKSKTVKCMLTGVFGNNLQVVCGHIIPCTANEAKIEHLGLRLESLNTSPNLIFWAIAIERAYECLKISFVKAPLADEYLLKIWDDNIRMEPIWEGSNRTIGEFENAPLDLGKRVVLTRGLSFQAIQAYNASHLDDKTIALSCLYGSPGNYSYQKELSLLRSQYEKDLAREVDMGDVGSEDD
jgi:hypothetical protein